MTEMSERSNILDAILKQNEIIQVQSDIIDHLASELLALDAMSDEDLAAIKRAAEMHVEAEAAGIL